MERLRALRLKLYQPQAHFRLPFTYRRRLTYPLPPYSTVVGFLANILGVESQEDESFKRLKEVSLAVSGTFSAKVTEYTWYRNLAERYHKGRFISSTNRIVDMMVEHPGGQSPVFIDTLHDLYLTIYVYHEDEGFLRELEEALTSLDRRREPLHLGRAEDLVVMRELKNVELIWVNELTKRYEEFFWIPINGSAFREYRNVRGIRQRLTTLYEIRGGARIFSYADVYLSDGTFIDVSCYSDSEYPVFLSEALDEISF